MPRTVEIHALPRWALMGLLAAFLVVQHGGALHAPFFSDDYIFFDKLDGAPFGTIWAADRLAYHWYRPLSRELHYWTFGRLFGHWPLPYHVASFTLWLGVMGFYASFVRRAAGDSTSVLAACGVAALAAWGVLIEWAPGVQELWMMLFALASIHAFARHRTAWATVFLAASLLSKESALVVPAVAFLYALAIDRNPPRGAVRRIVPLVALVMAWAAVHPSLGGRWWWGRGTEGILEFHTGPWSILSRSVLMPFNLDLWPRPLSGWGAALFRAVPGALVLALLATWALKSGTIRAASQMAGSKQPESLPAARGRLLMLGAGWTLIGWLPLFAPSLVWQSYYALFGALGMWIVIATLIQSRRFVAVTLVFLLALLRGARSDTPMREWGNEWVMRFGKSFMAHSVDYFKRRFPDPEPHMRLFFTTVPRGVVFVTNPYETPALRVWFRDRTVTGSFWSDYRPRRPDRALGSDFFFRFDSLRGWVEVSLGTEDMSAAMASNPQWQADQEQLALTFVDGGDVPGAARIYEKFAIALPSSVDHAVLAGLCYETMGDSIAASRWYAHAARLPGGDREVHAKARRFADVRRQP